MSELSQKDVPDGWNALLVCPDRGMAGDLNPLLSQYFPMAAVVHLQAYPPHLALSEVLSTHPANLCLLDVGSDRQKALGVLQELHELAPHLPVVALLPVNDPDLILTSLRQGAVEFLIKPFTSEQFQATAERLNRLNPGVLTGRANQGKVICVMPTKGACGASTIACNLAFQWKHLGSKRILLADLDPLTGTLAFLLKLKSNYSFVDALSHSGTLDADLWKALVARYQGIDVLLSPENPADGMQEAHDTGSIVHYSRQLYETVILDAPGPYGNWGLSMARLCDQLVLVTTNELPALQATQRSLSYMERNGVEREKIRLVVNRYSKDVGLSQEAIQTALHTDVFHVLASDYDTVQRALMEGKPIPNGSTLGKGLSALAEKLAGKEDKPVKRSGLFGLFSLISRG
jgi:pilus assembly protein CpaE